MNDSEVELTSCTSKRHRQRYSVWAAIITATVLTSLLLAWLWQSIEPSPFFSEAMFDGDPLEPILQRSLLRFVEDSHFNPAGIKTMSRLASELPPTEVLGSGGESGADGKGQWYSRQHRTIRCPPDVMEQVMSDLLTWSEYVCARTGARVYSGGGSATGRLITNFSFRYEYGRHQGVVWVTMDAPKSPAASAESPTHTKRDIGVQADSFDLRWDIRESVGPSLPKWVETADGRHNHWELELTGRFTGNTP